jgi:RNA polymerase sigma-70 factor (sigma-E family)
VNRSAEREFRDYVAGRQHVLFKIALLFTGHEQQAEDLLQSTLIRVAQYWSRISGADNMDAYVRRVMYHEHIAAWRRRRLRETLTGTVPERAHPTDLAAGVALRLRLVQALRTLPPQQRAALVLRFFEDLPEGEVASIMGVSVGTVRSHSARGLARLRETCPDLAIHVPQEVTR